MNERTKNIVLLPFNILYNISPELDLKLLYFLKLKKFLNLKKPKTFTEKLNWLKLYDTPRAKELKPYLSDKYTVREYVESNIKDDNILNELYWEGRDPNNIPFDKLPQQFVIKVTHGSTFNVICRDKENLDIEATKKKLKKWLHTNYLVCYGEDWYGKVEPRIIIEKYLENKGYKDLIDYKVFCFNGEPKLIHVHSGRNDDHRRNVYDINWNHRKDVIIQYPQAAVIEKPKVLSKLLEYSQLLSKEFAHARIDFYIIDNKIIFSEITFANGAGFSKIPYSHDLEMGEWIHLPIN